DLSFNKLTGQIPENFIGMGELQYLDVSYNNFMGNPPAQCQQANVNMVSSFYLQVAHSSLFINCGGKSLEVDGNIYADDSFEIGTSTFVLSDDKKWAYNSTGDFVAHLLPLSLKYYGLCMENGEYSVKLHFAEIVFTEDHTYSSNGKRVFDGFKVLKDFNIQDEAGGVHRVITKSFTTSIIENTLEIHFYLGGKVTTAIPDRGVYGPLISAISVTQSGIIMESTGAMITIIVAACLVVALALILCYIKFFQRKKLTGNGDWEHAAGASLRRVNTRAADCFPKYKIIILF
ncbi:hypothetical protein ABZP36_016485, partial [Zizania latifolia]